ncbi:MAG: DUF1801 domain-containing protein [bacterium]|nr:DUF1801 domain-containing protein [bacterium]MDZ4347731.1 DUF1801 domain-containing protein [Candidatus Binatia bacterium]
MALRKTIRAAAPMAEEKISYNIPLYTYRGHLVGFAAFKRHCSLFVTNSSVPKRFAKELAPFTINHTTIQFTPDNPLPAALVRKIVKVRVGENEKKV